MSYFIIWICYNLKIEYIFDDTNMNISISLLVKENRHIDVWKRIKLNEVNLIKLVKSLDTIRKKKEKRS